MLNLNKYKLHAKILAQYEPFDTQNIAGISQFLKVVNYFNKKFNKTTKPRLILKKLNPISLQAE